MEKLCALSVDEVVLVTNNKYYQHFVEWEKASDFELSVDIINDQTMSNDDKLGAI